MATFLLTFVVGFLAFRWMRWNARVRRERLQWLTRVNLAGQWTQEADDDDSVEFSGGPAEGTYRARVADRQEIGKWLLHGAHLTLTPEQGRPIDYDFRLFENGSIGIDGPGRPRRVYVRRTSNVVPLRRRQ
jgi:hypothetical protein